MDRKTLLQATAIGTVVQLAMIGAGHFVPFVRDHVFAIGGMLISLLAGLLYARRARGGWGSSLGGAAIVGGVCAVVGIGASVALGDTLAAVLGFGTIASVVAGLVGGAVAMAMRRNEA